MFLGRYSITVKGAPTMNYQNTAFFRRLFRIRQILKRIKYIEDMRTKCI